MSLFKIAWRSVQQRALASLLTGFSMALGVALIVAVLVIYGKVNESFKRTALGYDLIVGAKGSSLDLVLNTIYHLSKPVENIPYSYYKEFIREQTPAGERVGKYAPYVTVAIPYCLGDNYEGFRVVGTTPAMFDDFEYSQGRKYEFSDGRNFVPEGYFEAVIGSLVASKTRLKLGDEFQPTHGVANDGQGHKHDAFKVVGILEPTGTPNDRALFVNMEGFYLLRGHALEKPRETPSVKVVDDPHDEHDPHDEQDPHEAHDEHHEHDDLKSKTEPSHESGGGEDSRQTGELPHGESADHPEHADHEPGGHADHDDHHQPLPEELREVTAILLRSNIQNPVGAIGLPKRINKEPVAQAVLPAAIVYELFDGIIGNLQWLLLFLATLIVAVSGIGIMVSIYNSMSDRRREIAVMRSLGAARSTVMAIILLESIILSLGGGIGGFLLGHGLIGLLNPWIVAQTGVSMGFLQFNPLELALLPILVLLAVAAGYLPALAAYRTDVAKALTASP